MAKVRLERPEFDTVADIGPFGFAAIDGALVDLPFDRCGHLDKTGLLQHAFGISCQFPE